MVEGDILPAAGVMTGFANRAELSGMNVFDSMAGEAVFGRALEDPVRMTGLALNVGMQPGKREIGFGMVEYHILPAAGDMA